MYIYIYYIFGLVLFNMLSIFREAKEAKAAEEANRQGIKKEMDAIDIELKGIHTALKKTQDERDEVLRSVERAELKMEGLRSNRKNIIEQCTIDEIALPKKGVARGKGGDTEESNGPDDAQEDEMEVEGGSCSHSQSAIQAKEEMAKDRFDYSRLSRDHRRDMSEKDLSKVRNQQEEELAKAAEIINSMNPNMKAIDQLKEVEVRYTAVTDESKAAKENSQNLSKKFETVKQKRCDLFNR
jgi:structural maintenance of chromosome 1